MKAKGLWEHVFKPLGCDYTWFDWSRPKKKKKHLALVRLAFTLALNKTNIKYKAMG